MAASTGAPSGTDAASQQFTTFTLDGHLFGVEVETVQEVIRYQETTRVPLAPGSIGGLINLRGQVITALDLRHRLGLPDRAEGQRPMNVVVRTEDGAEHHLSLVEQHGAWGAPTPPRWQASTDRATPAGNHPHPEG